MTPLTFREVAGESDITISFEVQNHGDGARNSFDGRGRLFLYILWGIPNIVRMLKPFLWFYPSFIYSKRPLLFRSARDGQFYFVISETVISVKFLTYYIVTGTYNNFAVSVNSLYKRVRYNRDLLNLFIYAYFREPLVLLKL